MPIIEEGKRFSESLMWQGQRQFYHEQGVQAWSEEVPFYITSNPFIADCYAKIIVAFINDWVSLHPDSIKHPFYVIELGAGSGQFSYYVLKTLEKLLVQLKLSHIKLVYIMTDFTENNLTFWQNHKSFKPYFERGVLDCALFDMEKNTSIQLTHSQTNLSAGSVHNPITVIANYLFDSVVNDIFKAENGTLYESLITLSTAKENIKNDLPLKWQKVHIKHIENPIKQSYYKNKLLDSVLFNYPQLIKSGFISFPIGSLKGIKRLQDLSNNQLLLVSSDKGYVWLEEQEALAFPELDFHGSFSLMVNYHAISEYFKQDGGDSLLQSPRDSLSSGIFVSGEKFANLKQTQLFFDQNIEGFSPSDYFNLYEHLDEKLEHADLKFIASFLSLSHWDPFIFTQAHDHILKLVEKEEMQILDYLINNLDKIADNFFALPGCDDVFFNIALIYYEIDDYEKAIHYYLKSVEHFGEAIETINNLGLSYYYNKDYKNAVFYIEKLIAMDPHYADQAIKKILKDSRKKL